MGGVIEKLGGLVSERQYEGATFLYRGVPRSFKLLLLLFVALYGIYWFATILGAPAQVPSALYLAMGFLMAVAVVITLAKLWPRMEHALPQWFRGEVEAPALHPYLKYLTWPGLILLVIAAALYTSETVFAVVIFMGIAGGILILFIAEDRCLALIQRLKGKNLRPWMESGWASLALIITIFVIDLMILVACGTFIEEGPGPTKDVSYLLVILVTSFIIAVQALILVLFFLATSYRTWMRWRMTRGATYFGRSRALLNVRPLHLVLYLELMNLVTGVYVALYIFLLALQSSTIMAENGGINLLGSLAPLDGAVLDAVAWASIIMAWAIILVNLSGSAVRSEKWYINRNNFTAASVVIMMALLLQVITMHGDESTMSVLFRIFYMVGIMAAPLFVFWNRWKRQAALFPRNQERSA